MKIYLAAQYRRKDEMREYAATMRDSGHEACSTWLEEPHGPLVQLGEIPVDAMIEYSERDLGEIRNCDAMVFFSVSDQELTRRGGRHVEFGYALAHDKKILVVGPRENMFHFLPDVQHYPTFAAAMQALTPAADIQAPSLSSSEQSQPAGPKRSVAS